MISKAVECQERRWRFDSATIRSSPSSCQHPCIRKSYLRVQPHARGGKSSLLFLRPAFPMSAPRFKPPTAELLQPPCSKIST